MKYKSVVRVPLISTANRTVCQTLWLGTHEELLKTNAIYQEVYSSQTQGSGDFDKQGGEQ